MIKTVEVFSLLYSEKIKISSGNMIKNKQTMLMKTAKTNKINNFLRKTCQIYKILLLIRVIRVTTTSSKKIIKNSQRVRKKIKNNNKVKFQL